MIIRTQSLCDGRRGGWRCVCGRRRQRPVRAAMSRRRSTCTCSTAHSPPPNAPSAACWRLIRPPTVSGGAQCYYYALCEWRLGHACIRAIAWSAGYQRRCGPLCQEIRTLYLSARRLMPRASLLSGNRPHRRSSSAWISQMLSAKSLK